MKATVLAESSYSILFHRDLSAPATSTDVSQVDVALFNSFYNIFYHLIIWVIKSRKLGWVGHIATMEVVWRAFKMLTGKPTENRPLGRPRHRWKDNIRRHLKEICDNMRN